MRTVALYHVLGSHRCTTARRRPWNGGFDCQSLLQKKGLAIVHAAKHNRHSGVTHISPIHEKPPHQKKGASLHWQRHSPPVLLQILAVAYDAMVERWNRGPATHLLADLKCWMPTPAKLCRHRPRFYPPGMVAMDATMLRKQRPQGKRRHWCDS